MRKIFYNIEEFIRNLLSELSSKSNDITIGNALVTIRSHKLCYQEKNVFKLIGLFLMKKS